MEQKGRSIRRQPYQQQRGRAEQQKIEHRAQKEGCRHVDAHFSSAGGGGVAEEPHRDQKPEAQVQQGPHQRKTQAPPQDAEDIID